MSQVELGVFVQDCVDDHAAADAQPRPPLRTPHGSLGAAVGRRRAVRAGAHVRGAIESHRVEQLRAAAVAASFDLSGRGRTVLKASASQYAQRQGAQLIDQFNPLRQNTENRSWSDRNGDLVPQLDEIGPGQGALDRGATVRIDPGLKRPTQWEYSASLEHQLADDFAVAVSWFSARLPGPHGGGERRGLGRRLHAAGDRQPARRHAVHDLQPVAASIGRVDNVLLNSDSARSELPGRGSHPQPSLRRRTGALRRRDHRQQQGGHVGQHEPERSHQLGRVRPARLARDREPVGHLPAAVGRSGGSALRALRWPAAAPHLHGDAHRGARPCAR